MDLLNIAVKAALAGGEKIMKVYSEDFDIELKKDNSPITKADKLANEAILKILNPTEIPVISEEIKNQKFEQRSEWRTCWVVDPLDGTKEFIKKNGQFTVNIALIKNGSPILGIVYVPAEKKLYFASEEIGSYSTDVEYNEEISDISTLISKSKSLKEKDYPGVYTIVASGSHPSPETEKFIEACREEFGEVQLLSRGSSLKLCMVAEGKAQIYPRLAPTMEWDTAAAHAVAKFAGCKVLDYETQKELTYNKENLLNPYFVVLRNEDNFQFAL